MFQISKDLMPLSEMKARAGDVVAQLRLFTALKEAEGAIARGEVVEHEEMDELLRKLEADEG